MPDQLETAQQHNFYFINAKGCIFSFDIKWLESVLYRSHCQRWNATSLENPEEQARPHPDEK